MLHQNAGFSSTKIVATVLLALLFGIPKAVAQIEEEAAVEFAKKTLVSALDSALPKVAFGAWFVELVGPTAEVFWEMNDCGEQSGDPAVDNQRDLPVCVAAEALLEDGREITVMTSVGTWETGLAEKAVVRDIYWTEGQQLHQLKRLSELPALVRSEPPEPGDAAGAQERNGPATP